MTVASLLRQSLPFYLCIYDHNSIAMAWGQTCRAGRISTSQARVCGETRAPPRYLSRSAGYLVGQGSRRDMARGCAKEWMTRLLCMHVLPMCRRQLVLWPIAIDFPFLRSFWYSAEDALDRVKQDTIVWPRDMRADTQVWSETCHTRLSRNVKC